MVTISTQHRAPVFASHAEAVDCIADLERAATLTDFRLIAYCLMPNHLHLLAQGEHEEANLATFMQRFKQLSSYRHKKDTGEQLWERSYYDHVVRRDEDLRDIAAYIWQNPVKAGLAADATRYPYSGPRQALKAEWRGEVAQGSAADRAEAVSLQFAGHHAGSAAEKH